MPSLDVLLALLASCRGAQAVRHEEAQRAEERVRETPEWAEAERRLGVWEMTSRVVAELEGEVKEIALRRFVETGDKRPHPSVQIKEFTRLDYDKDLALAYAIKNLQLAVKLDATAFEKVAKVMPLEFVTVRKEPAAQIAKNLVMLAEAGDEGEAA